MTDRPRDRAFRLFAALALGLFALANIAFWIQSDDGKEAFVDETGPLQLGTAALFVVGALVGIAQLIRVKRARSWKLYGVIPLLSALGAADELSFGEWIFGAETPTVQGRRIDAVHDLSQVAFDWMRSELVFLGVVFGLIVVAACLLRSRKVRQWFSALHAYLPYKYLAIAALCGVCSILLDLEVARQPKNVMLQSWLLPLLLASYDWFLEEFIELTAALAMVFAGWAIGARAAELPASTQGAG